MNRFGKFLVASATVAIVAAGVAAASVFTNPGFESGDTSGWGSHGQAYATDYTYYGSGVMGSQSGTYHGVTYSGSENFFYGLWQTVDLGKKDKISGYAFFATTDYWPFVDEGQVLVLSGDENGSVVAAPLNESVATVGDFGSTGWRHWEYEVATPGTYTVLGRVRNIGDSGVASFVGLDSLEYEKGIIVATLDIKPGSSTNPVTLKSGGVIPVAVMGTADFDVTTVVVSSLRFGPGGATESHGKGHYEDVNGDGIGDLVLHFDTKATGLSVGDTSATLTGETSDGTPLEGSDVVSVK